jgi:glutaredoxin-dependent peroxiredoxin
MALPVGIKAPDFTLRAKNADGLYNVTLSDHYGKRNTVLLFYPGAFTHVCHQEMCDVTEDLGKYEGLNAAVYGISNDTPYCLEEWSKQLGIGFPLLSDFQHEVAQAYDVVWPNFSGLGPGTARAVFVIDKDGVIRYAEQTPTLLDLPSYEAIETALKGLETVGV